MSKRWTKTEVQTLQLNYQQLTNKQLAEMLPGRSLLAIRLKLHFSHLTRPSIHWARDWDSCQNCGTTDVPHRGQGLCQVCYNKQWRNQHPNYHAIKNACWQKEHQQYRRDYARRYRAQHQQETKQRHQKYYQEHRSDRLAYHHQYHHNHREKRAAYFRKYAQANPSKVRAHSARRRARQNSAPINDFTAHDWQTVLKHYNHQCAYCGIGQATLKEQNKVLTLDHIIPLSRGRPHTISNIAPACLSCNCSKATRTPTEAKMYLKPLPVTKKQSPNHHVLERRQNPNGSISNSQTRHTIWPMRG